MKFRGDPEGDRAPAGPPESAGGWIGYTVQAPRFGQADANYVMLPDMTYTWRVRTTSATKPGDWANSDPTVFYYEVQVSRDAEFGSGPGSPFLYWELRHGGVTTPPNSYSVPAAFPLEAGSTYHWRVRPRIQGDGALLAWSPTWSFTTP